MQSYSNSSLDYSADNQFDYGRRQPDRSQQRSRRASARRGGAVKASAFNGIHKRRNKHWSW